MGFQDVPKIVHEAASRKGGRIHTAKGLAKISAERRREITSMGGKAKYANRNKDGAKPSKEGQSDESGSLADVLGDLDEI